MLTMEVCEVWVARLPLCYGVDGKYYSVRGTVSKRPSCRAFRMVGDTKRFLYLKVPPEFDRKTLSDALLYLRCNGICLVIPDEVEQIKRFRYRFLGFTEAELKHDTLIFLRDCGEKPTKEELAHRLGTDGIINPGMYVASLDHVFSPSVDVLSISGSRMKEVEDVEASNGNFVSEGCGAIRQSLADKICRYMDISASTSVFEISIGMIKGIVAAYPDDKFEKCFQLGHKSNIDLVYRKSMTNIENHLIGMWAFELRGHSHSPPSSHLSWAIIAQLLSLSIKYDTFKELLDQQLLQLETITTDREQALHYLRNAPAKKSKVYIRELIEILDAGHNLEEPYVRDKLYRYRNAEYYDLKRRLNIRIQKSCQVYGIVDEIGILKRNEVYINLPRRDGVIVSDVVIARRTACKPGDIRVMHAVDVPELNFLTNCIVFPMNGAKNLSRPMPGSRLDTELFFVSWEPAIIPSGTIRWLTMHPEKRHAKTQCRRGAEDTSIALTRIFLDQRHNKLLDKMTDEWRVAVSSSGMFVHGRYPSELSRLIDIAKLSHDGVSCYVPLYKLYRSLRDQCHALVREGSSSPFRKLQSRILPGTVIRKIRYLPDKDLCIWKKRVTDERGLYEEAYMVLTKFRKDFAVAKRDDVRDKSDYGKGLLRCENSEFSRINQVRQRYKDRHFHLRSKGDITTTILQASIWYYIGYKYSCSEFAWLGSNYLNQIKKTNIDHKTKETNSIITTSGLPTGYYEWKDDEMYY